MFLYLPAPDFNIIENAFMNKLIYTVIQIILSILKKNINEQPNNAYSANDYLQMNSDRWVQSRKVLWCVCFVENAEWRGTDREWEDEYISFWGKKQKK